MDVRLTDEFDVWLKALKDRVARIRIAKRIERLEAGNWGDVKPVGSGVSELRVDYGPGYRLYCLQHGSQLIFMLAGGDKRTQDKDIATAITLANELRRSLI